MKDISKFPFNVFKYEFTEEELSNILKFFKDNNATVFLTHLAYKGGVSKTTDVHNKADYLGRLGFKVCTVDLDHQCNLTHRYGVYDTNNTAANMFLGGEVNIINVSENVDLIAGHPAMDDVERKLESKNGQYEILYFWLAKNSEKLNLSQYDFILFDTRPGLDLAAKNAVYVSNYAINPLSATKDEYESRYKMEANINLLREEIIDRRTLESLVTTKLKFELNKISLNNNVTKDRLYRLINEDKEELEDIISFIPYKEIFNKATSEDLTVFEYADKYPKEYKNNKNFFRELEQTYNNMIKNMYEDLKIELALE